MNALTHLSEAVRRRREALGLTLREVADRTGGELSHGTVGNIEAGRYDPKVSTLVLLAEALGVAPAGLLPPRKKNQKNPSSRLDKSG